LFIRKGYVDVDFEGEVDHQRSTTGYIFTVGTTSVSWMSQIQKILTLSNIELVKNWYGFKVC